MTPGTDAGDPSDTATAADGFSDQTVGQEAGKVDRSFVDLSEAQPPNPSDDMGQDGDTAESRRIELKDRGGVSKDRLAFEMLGTREVDRLFSTLEPCDVTGFRHKPGSLLDATALIGGTAVGAGILALPAATLQAGLIPSSIGLVMM